MDDNYRLVFDQSTSATKLLLLQGGRILRRLDKKHQQIYPKTGWVEHSPDEIWEDVQKLFADMLGETQLTAADIASISITNQRETILTWDKATGKPLYNALVWQDNRSSGICQSLIDSGYELEIQRKTGLRLDTYFSGPKIKWLFENVPSVREASEQGNLAVGTIDSWLIWKLTAGKVFATEASNACRTLLYNIREQRWDAELCRIFDVSLSDLPEVRKSSDEFGHYQGIPIRGVMADSQAALYGQGLTKAGEVKITMGTGCSVLMQLEHNDKIDSSEVLTTIVDSNETGTNYALEGIIRSCADSIHWFNESIAAYENIDEACNQVIENEFPQDIIFIPALEGLASPYWESEASGAFLGMKRNTSKNDLLYAILESIVFQIKCVLHRMEEVSGIPVKVVKVDGGVSKNAGLVQKLANLLAKELQVGETEELSALGALKTGNKIEILLNDKIYLPQEDKLLDERYSRWLSQLEYRKLLLKQQQ
ncbi:MAG: glycerol kinase [Streptococcaceae bacterium]|jgi:glycerol kinase|nr:glycerol kinase [Streptococcaceae bacterium]